MPRSKNPKPQKQFASSGIELANTGRLNCWNYNDQEQTTSIQLLNVVFDILKRRQKYSLIYSFFIGRQIGVSFFKSDFSFFVNLCGVKVLVTTSREYVTQDMITGSLVYQTTLLFNIKPYLYCSIFNLVITSLLLNNQWHKTDLKQHRNRGIIYCITIT